MAKYQKKIQLIGRQIWELFKASLVPFLMCVFASSVLLLVILNDADTAWNSKKLIWTIVLALASTAYMGFIIFTKGGDAYEMLVSGNSKRKSATDESDGYIISKHKYAKEYRVWKGFAIGGFTVLCTIVTGIIFGANQSVIDMQASKDFSALSVAIFLGFMLSGWSILPFFYMNASGIAVSYYYSCLFAVLPLITVGVMYIVGAYARRAKTLKRIAEEEAAQKLKEERKKKINYGGLPGTKPKKRK